MFILSPGEIDGGRVNWMLAGLVAMVYCTISGVYVKGVHFSAESTVDSELSNLMFFPSCFHYFSHGATYYGSVQCTCTYSME